MTKMDQILEYSLEAGRIMLESNSEIYRAEEVIVNVCHAFGIENIDVFTLATCIYLSINKDGQSYTRVKRIYKRETNLARISKVNSLSRSIFLVSSIISSFSRFYIKANKNAAT